MKKLVSLAFLVLLAACASEPTPEPIHVDFSGLGKIYLNSGDLRIIDRSKTTPQWKPYIGHLFSPTLTQVAHQVAADRVQTLGRIGHATFIIKDANLTEQALDKEDGLSSYFTRQQASKYIGRIEVILETQSPVDGAVGMATASAVHAVTLPENPTDYERQEAYRMLVMSLSGTLNRNLDQAVRTHLSRFLLPGPGLSPTTGSSAPRNWQRQGENAPPAMDSSFSIDSMAR